MSDFHVVVQKKRDFENERFVEAREQWENQRVIAEKRAQQEEDFHRSGKSEMISFSQWMGDRERSNSVDAGEGASGENGNSTSGTMSDKKRKMTLFQDEKSGTAAQLVPKTDNDSTPAQHMPRKNAVQHEQDSLTIPALAGHHTHHSEHHHLNLKDNPVAHSSHLKHMGLGNVMHEGSHHAENAEESPYDEDHADSHGFVTFSHNEQHDEDVLLSNFEAPKRPVPGVDLSFRLEQFVEMYRQSGVINLLGQEMEVEQTPEYLVLQDLQDAFSMQDLVDFRADVFGDQALLKEIINTFEKEARMYRAMSQLALAKVYGDDESSDEESVEEFEQSITTGKMRKKRKLTRPEKQMLRGILEPWSKLVKQWKQEAADGYRKEYLVKDRNLYGEVQEVPGQLHEINRVDYFCAGGSVDRAIISEMGYSESELSEDEEDSDSSVGFGANSGTLKNPLSGLF